MKKCTSVYFPILTDPMILLLSGESKFGTHSGDCREERERNTEIIRWIGNIKSSIRCYPVKSCCIFVEQWRSTTFHSTMSLNTQWDQNLSMENNSATI